jgi:hypothetical protein
VCEDQVGLGAISASDVPDQHGCAVHLGHAVQHEAIARAVQDGAIASAVQDEAITSAIQDEAITSAVLDRGQGARCGNRAR